MIELVFMVKKILFCFVIALTLFSCKEKSEYAEINDIDRIAEKYVKLVIITGKFDSDYVDAYFGPDSLKKAADSSKMKVDEIVAASASLLESAQNLNADEDDVHFSARKEYLCRQIEALNVKAQILKGIKLSFDRESAALYDLLSPIYNIKIYNEILAQLNNMVPGGGDLSARIDNFRRNFIIPSAKLDTCFKTAINECRRRSLSRLKLPVNEKFTVEYVKGASWAAYNWFKGRSYSLIQVNTGLPFYVDRMVGLASHEGYPGHHVFHSLTESELLKKRNWIEYSVYPLFSPSSGISEGLANYGVELAFPGNEKIAFEKKVLYPLAGLNPSMADSYEKINELIRKLDYAGNEIARRYLDGNMSRERAIEWLMKYNLMNKDRAERRLKFVEKYRTYVVTYNVGYDIIKKYIEKKSGGDLNKKWDLYRNIIMRPELIRNLK